MIVCRPLSMLPHKKLMKKIEKTATSFFKAILPAIYMAPMVISAWGFVSFVQWAS